MCVALVCLGVVGCGAAKLVTDLSLCGSNSHFEGHVLLEGVVSKTKGGQLELEGNIVELPPPDGGEGLKLRAKNAQWYGKRVKVEGDRCVPVCDPRAQCYGGAYLRNVELLEVR